MDDKHECLGTMIPALNDLNVNTLLRGKVFKVLLESTGIGAQSTLIEEDKEAWESCRRCSDFQSCYDLSLARCILGIALHQKVWQTGRARPG